jgi:prepilin-type processing-associated H-X9-DG protein
MYNPSVKVFLADSCRVDRSNPREISNREYGYSDAGAWLNEKDVEHDSPSLSYRFEPARSQAYRHLNGINMLFFDGHVEHQPEGSSETNKGFGSGSRQAKFWFPTGTNTREIPSGNAFSNPKIIVP